MTEDKQKEFLITEGRLVATRLPLDLATKVERAAQREMISTAAFLRRAVASAVRDLQQDRARRARAKAYHALQPPVPVEAVERRPSRYTAREKAAVLARARRLTRS